MASQHLISLIRLYIFLLAIYGAFEGWMVESSVIAEDLNNDQLPERFVNASIVDHTSYHNYEKIEEYLTKFQTEYSDHVTVGQLDFRTFEGRAVKYIKLNGSSHHDKPVIIIEAGIHAREWIAPAATLYVIERLLQGNGNDRQIDLLLDTYDWYFIPVANPDGYSFTFTGDENRFWRKNRRIINGTCVGVDLNRNFDINYGKYGVSSDCNEDNYLGEYAFSEPETRNVRNMYNRLASRIISVVSIHSCANWIFLPWSYPNAPLPSRCVELNRVADLMAFEMNSTHGHNYRYGTFTDFSNGDSVSGNSLDWVFSKNESIYSYSIELMPDRTQGSLTDLTDLYNFCFNHEPSEIIHIGEELLAGLLKMAEVMKF